MTLPRQDLGQPGRLWHQHPAVSLSVRVVYPLLTKLFALSTQATYSKRQRHIQVRSSHIPLFSQDDSTKHQKQYPQKQNSKTDKTKMFHRFLSFAFAGIRCICTEHLCTPPYYCLSRQITLNRWTTIESIIY